MQWPKKISSKRDFLKTELQIFHRMSKLWKTKVYSYQANAISLSLNNRTEHATALTKSVLQLICLMIFPNF